LFTTNPGRSPSPLERVYRTKFALLAVVSTFLGLALIVLAHWAAASATAAWLRDWPLNEVGLGLFMTGLFGVLFQYVGQRDAEEEHVRRLREVIADDLAGNRDGLVALVSSETRDRIAEHCLGIQLGDEAMAHDLYTDLREQIIRQPERRYDMDLSIALAPWSDGPACGDGAMFVATVRTAYRVIPVQPVMRFACVSDVEEYGELLRDPSCTAVHRVKPVGGVDGASEQAFQVVEVSVDGTPRPLRRLTRPGAQTYTATLGRDVMAAKRSVAISYTYRALIKQHGHLFHVDFSRPTKGVTVQFAYGGCGIRHVDVVGYIASTARPGVSRLSPTSPTPSVALRFDGWTLPKAGVAFTWVLEREVVTADDDTKPSTELRGTRPVRPRNRAGS